MTCKIVQIANCSITKYANSQIIAIVIQKTKLNFRKEYSGTKKLLL